MLRIKHCLWAPLINCSGSEQNEIIKFPAYPVNDLNFGPQIVDKSGYNAPNMGHNGPYKLLVYRYYEASFVNQLEANKPFFSVHYVSNYH